MVERVTCAKVPCISCPYRKDVPSGIWSKVEYDKLPQYDGTILEQITNGGQPSFFCHQNNGKLCAGWLGTHKPKNLLALRLRRVADEVWDYVSPVPVFESGAEAAKHGMRDIKRPNRKAREMIAQLLTKRPELQGPGTFVCGHDGKVRQRRGR